jgi:hypothetical protein
MYHVSIGGDSRSGTLTCITGITRGARVGRKGPGYNRLLLTLLFEPYFVFTMSTRMVRKQRAHRLLGQFTIVSATENEMRRT